MSILDRGHVGESALAEIADDPEARQHLSAAERQHLAGCDRCLGLVEGHRRAMQLFAAPWRFVAAEGPAAEPAIQRVRGVVSAGGGVGLVRFSHPLWIVATLVLLSALVGTGLIVGALRSPDGPSSAVTVGPSNEANPSPSSNPSPSPIATSTWSAFSSRRYGVTISHPGEWIVRAATGSWSLEVDQAPNGITLGLSQVSSTFMLSTDHFFAGDLTTIVAVYGMALPEGTTYEAFLERYRPDEVASMERVTIDGHDAALVSGDGYIEAMMQFGGRVYIFSGYGVVATNRLLFDALLSTVHLDPAAADDTPVKASPAPS